MLKEGDIVKIRTHGTRAQKLTAFGLIVDPIRIERESPVGGINADRDRTVLVNGSLQSSSIPRSDIDVT